MKWFADKVSEDIAEPDDELVVLPEDSGPPVIPVDVVDESDTLNDLQAFYADNENVAADIDPQLSSIIGNLMKARLPEDKLKGKLRFRTSCRRPHDHVISNSSASSTPSCRLW